MSSDTFRTLRRLTAGVSILALAACAWAYPWYDGNGQDGRGQPMPRDSRPLPPGHPPVQGEDPGLRGHFFAGPEGFGFFWGPGPQMRPPAPRGRTPGAPEGRMPPDRSGESGADEPGTQSF